MRSSFAISCSLGAAPRTHRRPASWRSLVRPAVLAALARQLLPRGCTPNPSMSGELALTRPSCRPRCARTSVAPARDLFDVAVDQARLRLAVEVALHDDLSGDERDRAPDGLVLGRQDRRRCLLAVVDLLALFELLDALLLGRAVEVGVGRRALGLLRGRGLGGAAAEHGEPDTEQYGDERGSNP